MKNKKIIGLVATATIVGSFCLPGLTAFADSFNVMAIGANLTPQQKQEMVTYFNAKPNSYQEVTINNQEEQKELKGIIPESEIGTRTISCAYVQPTQSGGINVKTANLTYVTASMISNALTTAGIYNANVIAAAPFEVSGTGALTGIMTSFEKATGQTISPEKKELANKELATTTKIAADPNVGATKAAAVVNGVKAKVIQNGNQDSSQVAKTINNVTNNYGVKLTPEQTQELNNVMVGISKQDYNKSAMEKSLDNMQEQLNKVLDNQGQLNGMMNKLEVHWDTFVNWISNIFTNNDNSNNIVNKTNNDSNIGKTAEVTGNNDNIKNAAPVAETPEQQNATLKVEPNNQTETTVQTMTLTEAQNTTVVKIQNMLADNTGAKKINKTDLDNTITKVVKENLNQEAFNKYYKAGYELVMGYGEQTTPNGINIKADTIVPYMNGYITVSFNQVLSKDAQPIPENKVTPNKDNNSVTDISGAKAN